MVYTNTPYSRQAYIFYCSIRYFTAINKSIKIYVESRLLLTSVSAAWMQIYSYDNSSDFF